MEAGVARVQGSRDKPDPHGVRQHAGAHVTLQSARLALLADGAPADAALLARLLRIAQLRLAEQHDNGEFVFTVTGEGRPGSGCWPRAPVTWRKVARADQRKVVRGLRAASTRVVPGARIAALDRVFPPGVVDHECRPYELGWLLYTWLS